jgi:lipid A ethanolaminephosphotransferase
MVLLAGVAFAALSEFAEVEQALHQWRRRDVDNPVFNTLVFVGPYILGVFGLVLTWRHGPPWARWTTLALAGIAVAADLGFRLQNGIGFTPFEASLVWQEPQLVADALRFYAVEAFLGVGAALAMVAAVEGVNRRWPPGWTSVWVLVVPVLAILAYDRLLVVTHATVIEFPLPYRVPLLAAYAARYPTHYHGDREAPAFEARDEPLADHIVFVMDESIRGDLLHLNGAVETTSPWLDAHREALLNFGVSCAPANLSGPSNLITQSGLRPDEIPDYELRSLKGATVFAYAERAGFATIYLNAQNPRRRPPNFMSVKDVAALDAYVELREQRPDLAEWAIDRELPALVSAAIREHARSFTWVLKSGVHFPYGGKWPPGHDYEGPLDRDDLDAGQEAIVRDYLSALQWSSDGFLEALVDELRDLPGRILVVYTADHGQSLFEPHPERPGWKGLRGHGTKGPVPPQQAFVPLLLMPLDSGVAGKLRDRFDEGRVDRVSAFELFPTLLELMGYAPADVVPRYGPGLLDPGPRPRRRFLSGNHFGEGGPLYRPAPYRTAFDWNDCDTSVASSPTQAPR